MFLYKYLSLQFGLEALQSRSLKVARLLELNDPADCRPNLVNGPSFDSQDKLEEFTGRYFRDLYRDVGALCFSSKINDPVVWSHYADSHRGMALGFFFHPSGIRTFDIKYQENRPEIDYIEAEKLRSDGTKSGEFISKIVADGFRHKAPSWSYENEYRYFVWLGNCTMRGAHYFDDHAGVPAKVVLGMRCGLTEMDIKRSMQGRSLKVEVSRACLDTKGYTLRIETA